MVSPTILDLKGPRTRREMRYLALSPIEGARWGQAALAASAYLLMYIYFSLRDQVREPVLTS